MWKLLLVFIFIHYLFILKLDCSFQLELIFEHSLEGLLLRIFTWFHFLKLEFSIGVLTLLIAQNALFLNSFKPFEVTYLIVWNGLFENILRTNCVGLKEYEVNSTFCARNWLKSSLAQFDSAKFVRKVVACYFFCCIWSREIWKLLLVFIFIHYLFILKLDCSFQLELIFDHSLEGLLLRIFTWFHFLKLEFSIGVLTLLIVRNALFENMLRTNCVGLKEYEVNSTFCARKLDFSWLIYFHIPKFFNRQ